MAELNAGELAELVDPEAIAHIIFNENRSLSGPQSDDANAAVGHVVLNLLAHGEPVGNGILTAKIGLPEKLPNHERAVLEQARKAAAHVIEERTKGIDPTEGAREYNHRAIDPNWTKERAYRVLRAKNPDPCKTHIRPAFEFRPAPISEGSSGVSGRLWQIPFETGSATVTQSN